MTTHYTKSIIFTKTPLKGSFIFKDIFRIYPLDSANAPKNSFATHYPCILETTYQDSEIKKIEPFKKKHLDEMLSRSTVQTNKVLQITNLLSAITNFRFFSYRNLTNIWSIPLPEVIPEDYDNIKSSWVTSIFAYPDIAKELFITKFTELQGDEIPRKNNKIYYYYDPVESSDKIIDFPENIDTLLDSYFNLIDKDRVVLDSAIFMLCNGLDIFDTMKSLSFISIVSSIETLVHYEDIGNDVTFECGDCKTLKTSNKHCKKCGRPIWGVTAKFRDFLTSYVSKDPKAISLYSKIYNLRSKIAHTEYLINNENYGNWEFTDKTEEIITKHLEAKQLSRRAIASWLDKRPAANSG